MLIRVTYAVYPAHIAFVLLNEGAGDEPAPGSTSHRQIPLFASVIQKAGGDAVSAPYVHSSLVCNSTL